ncbi:MAG: type I restriction enzyme HsdR N-terminal domain-containing protein [Clostridium beijerinckii]|jgi:integrase|nr:type I restriction enzyme HsdR N-terminal domain-containing protein [Clostridium beijerinckii]MCI1578930.1 type I restriction enzyme HsdR N-terminal domain-containing protein [Clostridium beijerinckii]MCI1582241.1 type I restriction enzyme HsdR N-terminal domain-containing protein [Clostridium beijerinckii]MCI1622758.1 type I restriction enzyme HsdR N-terminal domain-containing protein [Clostridium beijerinckii]
MEITLEYLIKVYNDPNNIDANEATINEKIVIPFLEYIGYKKEWGTPLKRIDAEDECDRLIRCPNGNKLIVEVKSKNYELNDKAKRQLDRYLNSEGIDWGILTNGNQYLLMYSDLKDIKPHEKYCLRYDLICEKFHITSKSMNNLFLNYFTYDYLFQRKATRLFAEFQRFKIKSLSSSSSISIKQYESANFNFFNYLSKDNNSIVDLADLKSRNLTKYFKNLLENKKLSKQTIINKFRYIKSFVDFLEKEDILLDRNDFTKVSEEELIKELDLSSAEKEIAPITLDEIESLLKLQENDSKNGLRNILVTQLICYLALSRESLINIKDTDIIAYDKKNKKKITSKDIKKQNFDDIEMYYLKINNICVKLPKSMTKTLTAYIKQRKNDRIKFNDFFYSQYTMDNQRFKKMTVSTINQIINDSFNKINSISEERRKHLNYSLLRTSVIKLLYKNFSLEELSKFTCLNVDTLYKYLIDSDLLKTKVDKVYTKLFNDHPLNEKIF